MPTTLRIALWDHCLAAAGQIAEGSSNTGLVGCGAPIIALLQQQATQIVKLDAASAPPTLVARRLDDLLELAHARFYAFPPSDVPACWRHLYTDASILLFAIRWRSFTRGATSLEDNLDSLVGPLDLALILAGGAGPAGRGRAWIHTALDLVHAILEGTDEGEPEEPQRKRSRLDTPRAPSVPDFSSGPMFNDKEATAFVPPVRHRVPRSGPLGLEAFQAYLDRTKNRQPLVLSGMTDHWPARQTGPGGRPWSSPDYLRWRTLRGCRLVPVEIGRSYVDDGWGQALVPFRQVLDELVDPVPRAGGPTYLAQHALFSQMPWLQQDIAVPDACYTTTGEDDDEGDVLINAWLGPRGTITPLHTDPHHNLLAQVVGRKYVRLYAPEQTQKLRPRGREAGGVDMGNTSALDVGTMEGWDETASDNAGGEDKTDEKKAFQDIPYVDCILEAGDTLYIPQGWWHYVRGLSVSFSVSFWWN